MPRSPPASCPPLPSASTSFKLHQQTRPAASSEFGLTTKLLAIDDEIITDLTRAREAGKPGGANGRH
jgi:hypothetical protein